jgi:chromosomal replication initiation ATPase DnaA
VEKTLESFTFKSSLRRNGRDLTDQELKKIYCSVLLNLRDDVTIVVNDILLGEGKGLEREFIEILMSLKAGGKRIVYLSSEMYMTYSVVQQDEIGEGKDFNVYEVNFQNISMR